MSGKPGLYRDCFELYNRYIEGQHGSQNAGDDNLSSYYSFLINSGLPSSIITSYVLGDDSELKLLANGYLDVLPNGISSVYFAWEPVYAKRSLGVFSVLKEIELCLSLNKDYYYLGFWVPLSPSMDYKAHYGPAEVALDGNWVALSPGLKEDLQKRFIDT